MHTGHQLRKHCLTRGPACRVLTLACKSQIKQLVSRGANINATDYDKRSPMHLACSEGHSECTPPGHALPQPHALPDAPPAGPREPRPQFRSTATVTTACSRAHIFLCKSRAHSTRSLLHPFGARGWCRSTSDPFICVCFRLAVECVKYLIDAQAGGWSDQSSPRMLCIHAHLLHMLSRTIAGPAPSAPEHQLGA